MKRRRKPPRHLKWARQLKLSQVHLQNSMESLLRYRPNRARSRFSLPSSVAKPPLSCLSIRWLASNLYNAILLTTRRYARVWTGLLIDTLCHIWKMCIRDSVGTTQARARFLTRSQRSHLRTHPVFAHRTMSNHAPKQVGMKGIPKKDVRCGRTAAKMCIRDSGNRIPRC